ncbi:hypothetical protein GH733_016530 [Mirounga leonina]|nr:hypothetical protein GH733_016530 [Mirounga leonina]
MEAACFEADAASGSANIVPAEPVPWHCHQRMTGPRVTHSRIQEPEPAHKTDKAELIGVCKLPRRRAISWTRTASTLDSRWFPGKDIRSVTDKAIGHWPGKLQDDWQAKRGQPDSALVIGQGMVVTSQEGTVMPQGCYKSTATAEAKLTREMALWPQLFLLFFEFSTLFSVPALGKPPAHSSCPGPLTNTLHTTFVLAPIFLSLCGPERPRTCTW